MSGASGAERVCAICGTAIPGGARYCPGCGARQPDEPATPSFDDAIADVLDDQPAEPPPPTFGNETLPPQTPYYDAPPPLESPPPPSWSPPPPLPQPTSESQPTADPGWSGTPAWTATPGSWGPAAAQQPAMVEAPGNRVLWTILAIVGFILFCCCGLMAVVFATGAGDSALQDEIANGMIAVVQLRT